MACPNQVVASVIDQQIVFEYRLCAMDGQPRGKTAVCSLDVAVAIVYPDDLHALMVFHRLHSSFLFACPNLRWSSRSFTSLPLGGGLSSTSYLSPEASHDTRCRVPAHLVIVQVEAERVDAGVVLKVTG